MNWIAGIQHALDYIEEHITEDMDFQVIASQAYSSSFYFQRVFSILCGMTLGDYIRNRRLSLAGTELASSGTRVIDTAVKYGYDSAESFSRAFTKFHGISPSQAKIPGVQLKSFSKLSVKLTMEGGNMINYRIEEHEAFNIIEKVRTFTTEGNLNFKEIPAFWKEAKKDGTIPTLCRFMGNQHLEGMILGICYEENRDTDFSYSIAAEYNGKSPVPEGFTIHKVPAETWAVFSCRGPMPTAIQNLWKEIYSEFFPASEFSPRGELSFEAYPDGDTSAEDYTCEIWIAVEKTSQ